MCGNEGARCRRLLVPHALLHRHRAAEPRQQPALPRRRKPRVGARLAEELLREQPEADRLREQHTARHDAVALVCGGKRGSVSGSVKMAAQKEG